MYYFNSRAIIKLTMGCILVQSQNLSNSTTEYSYMKCLNYLFAGLFAILLSAGPLFAQQVPQQQPTQQPAQPQAPAPEEISDDELLTFLEASDAIRPIQEEAHAEIQQTIEDEGITLERFQQLMMAMQNPQMADQVDISADEEQAIREVQPKLMEIEVAASEEIQSEIANKGIEVERYQAIFMSLQQHPELMERLEEMME